MDLPRIGVSAEARAKIDAVKAGNQFPDANLRLRISARQGPFFTYQLALEDPRDRGADDLLVDADGLLLVVDPESAASLDGAQVVLDEAVPGGGLRVENPNEGWKDPVAAAVQQVIDRQVNPGVARHGGVVALLEVRGDTAYIELGGGCVGCAQVDVTLRHGIETAITGGVPQIKHVVDQTDHASGTNPYFRPSKK
jgi:Fe/S biogenesis protein NfuA